MMKRIEFEAKTLKEAQDYAKNELNASLEHIKINVLKEKKGILGIGSSTTYEAILDINVAFEGKKYLETIFSGLGIDVITEFRTLDDGKAIHYHVQSEHNAILIGYEGRTLDALQVLLRTYITRITQEHMIVSLDVGGYKESRRRQLEIIATKTAKEVAFTGISAKLDPMNSYERRIIHTKLAEWRDVYTESEGEGEERAIIIKPKKK